MEFSARFLSKKEFSQMQREWQKCLEASSSDKLFMSWPWLFTWWETWSKKLKLELFLVGVFDSKGNLVGIGPFYKHRYRTPAGLKVSRIHMLGNAWRIAPTVRTEYSSIIAIKNAVSDIEEVVFKLLSTERWGELIVNDIVEETYHSWKKKIKYIFSPSITLQRSKDKGVCIEVSGDFREWLGGLGQNTRLKLYNRRSYIKKMGNIEILSVSSDCDVRCFFNELNVFHSRRWGTPCFDRLAIDFHLALRRRLDENQEAQYRVIKFNGKVVSLLYDIRSGRRVYNLQSGYFDNFDKKVSLGTLHLGYAIEEAFSSSGVLYYDLLAGAGKNTFYKKRLNGKLVFFSIQQLVRNPFMQLFYRQQAYLPEKVRKGLRKIFKL